MVTKIIELHQFELAKNLKIPEDLSQLFHDLNSPVWVLNINFLVKLNN
ncbi:MULTISPECIES: hypothetical protein [Xenorhabdus]|uniref:Uncharacterized protein n=2 Tax=Xenorhabdus TaxID=626 RepID=A0A2G0PYV1_XENHO|nr:MULTISPECIES: hypothetical protein [Xenorhabdus]PHM52140.1 hypothetical protein Xhom_04517 [Xenorhabdus hominickii]PHM52660.1 hypothetical protein Xhom_04328 [Xenorhabdus hominickii]QTL40650.1 hypothetical protein HGO23_04520 [Xenorhabdus budapestensis]